MDSIVAQVLLLMLVKSTIVDDDERVPSAAGPKVVAVLGIECSLQGSQALVRLHLARVVHLKVIIR